MKKISWKLLVMLLVLLSGGSLALAYAQPLTADEGLIDTLVSEEIPLEDLINESELLSEESELLFEDELLESEIILDSDQPDLDNGALEIITELDENVLTQREDVIDVVSTASTTATINEWYSLDEDTSITNATTTIKGKINVEDVYTQTITQAGWGSAATTRSTIFELFIDRLLIMSIDNGTKIIETKVKKPHGNQYSFEFSDLDLTEASKVSFRIENISFYSESKPSELIFVDMEVLIVEDPINPPSLGFGDVEDFYFEQQIFSYDIDQAIIEQKGNFSIEITGTQNNDWKLSASHSGQMSDDINTVDAEIYFKVSLLSETGTPIVSSSELEKPINDSTKLIFGQGNNFTLRLENPYQIKGDTTYTTTIYWTLQNVSVE